MAHAKLSASGADRWLNCPGSIAAEEGIERKSSVYAREGTGAHDLGERCLLANVDPEDYLGQKVDGGFCVSHEMVMHVRSYVDYVKNVADSHSDARLFVEQQVPYSNWVPDGFGTADAIVISEKDSCCHVVDLKYGKGVSVSAVDNNQLKMYALGVMQLYSSEFSIDRFVLHVVQPRTSNYSEWEISAKDLNQFGRYARAQARLALTDDAPRKPSEKACTWCSYKSNCPELFAKTQEILSVEFENLEEAPKSTRLTDEQKRKIYDSKGLIDSFFKAIESDIFETLSKGDSFPGYKLVEGRSIRKWKPEAKETLESLLGEKAYEKKLIGVTAAEAMLGKKEMQQLELTEKPPGKPTIAPESDRRKPLETRTCENMFEII